MTADSSASEQLTGKGFSGPRRPATHHVCLCSVTEVQDSAEPEGGAEAELQDREGWPVARPRPGEHPGSWSGSSGLCSSAQRLFSATAAALLFHFLLPFVTHLKLNEI